MNDDLISRQMAIDVAVDAVDDWDGGCNRTRERMISEAMSKIPSAQQWIPATERMPNPNEYDGWVDRYFLVQNEFGDMMVARCIKYYNGKCEWEQIHKSHIDDKVVAWMELPEKYKESE